MEHGFVVIDKPVGMTSHDVVRAVRRIVGCRSVGHTGTLDPFASGVLVVAVGAATKMIRFLDESRKIYRATARLGERTDTGDLTGTVIKHASCDGVDHSRLEELFLSFVGDSEQLPPMFSAVKRNGVKLYELARKGVEVDRAPRPVTIHSLSLETFSPPFVTFLVHCSKGTYVRTLADDMGETLGCGAHLTSLRRLASGVFTIDQSLPLESFARRGGADGRPWVTVDEALSHLPLLQLDDITARRVLDGLLPTSLVSGSTVMGLVRLVDAGGGLLAVATFDGSGEGRTGRLERVFPELCALHSRRGVV